MDVNTWNEPGKFKVQVPDLDLSVTISVAAGTYHGRRDSIVSIEGPEPDYTVTDEILNKARHAFWMSIAESYPKVSRGDVPFDSTDAWDITARGAVERWLELNAPHAPALYLNGNEVQP